jgi:hypothetical protein
VFLCTLLKRKVALKNFIQLLSTLTEGPYSCSGPIGPPHGCCWVCGVGVGVAFAFAFAFAVAVEVRLSSDKRLRSFPIGSHPLTRGVAVGGRGGNHWSNSGSEEKSMEPGSADCSSIRTTLDDDDCDAESERSVGVLLTPNINCPSSPPHCCWPCGVWGGGGAGAGKSMEP